MNEKQQGVLAAIELMAGIEAQRIALAAINAAAQGGLIPSRQYHVAIDAKIHVPSVLAPASAIDQVRPS